PKGAVLSFSHPLSQRGSPRSGGGIQKLPLPSRERDQGRGGQTISLSLWERGRGRAQSLSPLSQRGSRSLSFTPFSKGGRRAAAGGFKCSLSPRGRGRSPD